MHNIILSSVFMHMWHLIHPLNAKLYSFKLIFPALLLLYNLIRETQLVFVSFKQSGEEDTMWPSTVPGDYTLHTAPDALFSSFLRFYF